MDFRKVRLDFISVLFRNRALRMKRSFIIKQKCRVLIYRIYGTP